MELKRKYKSEERSEAGGLISSTMSASRYGSPAEYLDKMKSDGEFADHLFIQMTGAVLSADIIILYLHEDSTQNKIYVRIPGGTRLKIAVQSLLFILKTASFQQGTTKLSGQLSMDLLSGIYTICTRELVKTLHKNWAYQIKVYFQNITIRDV